MAEKSVKQNTNKLVKASARYLHISPRKMRLVTNLVKNRNVSDALVQLQHLDKKASGMVIKLLRSAVANAKNNFSLDPEKLIVKRITTDQGPVLKRYFPRARGSAFVIRRKLCHVNVILEEQRQVKPKSSRLALFKQAEKQEAAEAEPKAAVQEKLPKEEAKKTKTFKTEEQAKQSRVQQKRRLFNRKGGE